MPEKMFELLKRGDIEELMPVAKRMTEYIHDNKFDTIIVGGTSATTAAYMVKTWWQKLYTKQKTPDFLSAAQIKGGLSKMVTPTNGRLKEVGTILKNKHAAKLSPEKKYFILEEYAFSGRTASAIKSELKKIGLTKIAAGTLAMYCGTVINKEFDFIGALTDTTPQIHARRRGMINQALYARQIIKEIIASQPGSRIIRYHKENLSDARKKLKGMRSQIRAHAK